MGKFIGKAILLIGFSLWTMGVTDIVGAYQDRGQRVQLKPDGNRPVTLYSGSYALVIGVSRYTNGWTNLPGVSRMSRLFVRHWGWLDLWLRWSIIPLVSSLIWQSANSFQLEEQVNPTGWLFTLRVMGIRLKHVMDVSWAT